MNSPLSIIEHKLPIELINIIQTYLINEIALEAIYYHIDYLYNAQDDYEEALVNDNECKCYRYFNPRANRWKEADKIFGYFCILCVLNCNGLHIFYYIHHNTKGECQVC